MQPVDNDIHNIHSIRYGGCFKTTYQKLKYCKYNEINITVNNNLW